MVIMDNVLNMEEAFKEKMFLDEIERLKSEITKLKIKLKDAGIDENINDISDEEVLIITQIALLKDSALERELDTDEVKRFDLLHKNLKLINSGKSVKKRDKLKGLSTNELIKELRK